MKKIIILLCILLSFFGYAQANDRNDISSTSFKLDVCDFTPGGCELVSSSADRTIDNLLERIMTRLIIGIGTIALLVMTIGAGQMILYAGEDERLTKWKTMFTWWLMAVALALLSWLMVQLIAFLIYIT